MLRDTTQFLTRFLLPVAAAAGITIVAIGGFLTWSAQRIDADAIQREIRLMARALDEEKAQMLLVQEEMAIWDEAVTAYERGDIAWLVENIGVGAYQYYDHNRTILVDRQIKPIFAVQDGGQIPAKAMAASLADLRPLFAELESLKTQAAISAYHSGVNDTPPSAMAFMLFDAEPALVSVMPVLSYSGENPMPVGTEPLYISVVLLDEVLAEYLGDQYLVSQPRFSTQQPEHENALLIKGSDGSPIAWLDWEPDRPGARLLFEALPALLGGLAIAALIIGLLLRSLRVALAQLQAEREDAHHRALHDPLTGLGNRSLFHATLAENIRTMPRGEPRLALLALDLDRFKQVNDSMGHAAGDELLRQVGARLALLLRPQDTLVRLGGDEFAIIQPAISGRTDAEKLAKAVIEALATPFLLKDGTANIGVSVGIATAPDIAIDEDTLNRCADDALYRAKQGGRNRYCLYVPDTNAGVIQLGEQLRGAGFGR